MQEHEVLERELKELIAFEESGIDLSGSCKYEKMDKKTIKARVRMIKNRLAAKRSREHARTYVQELEGTLEALQSKNEALARRLAAVEAENERLKRAKTSSGDSSNNTKSKIDRASEPAALIYTSLQLDAVTLLLSMLLSTLLAPVPAQAAPAATPPPAASPKPEEEVAASLLLQAGRPGAPLRQSPPPWPSTIPLAAAAAA